MYFLYFTYIILNIDSVYVNCNDDLRLTVITFEDGNSDGFQRFMLSAEVNNLHVDVLGKESDNLQSEPGVDWRLNILRQMLLEYKDERNMVLLCTEARHTVIQSNASMMLRNFIDQDAEVLMSATNIKSDYEPEADFNDGYLDYLSARGFIGYAPDVYRMLTFTDLFSSSAQEYYSNIWVNHSPDKINMQLDRNASIFQNLDSQDNNTDLRMYGDKVKATNNYFKVVPGVIIADDKPENQMYLHYLANYVPNRFSFENGCVSCKENLINLIGVERETFPTVLIGLFILLPTPFMDHFLEQVSSLDYPKDKIHLFIHNVEERHSKVVEAWIESVKNEYQSVNYRNPKPFIREHKGRNFGISWWKKLKTDYYFSIDSSVSLTNPYALQLLIERNKDVIAPLVTIFEKNWSNFWGDITADGDYKRSEDFVELVKGFRVGVWNVPHISDVYLMKAAVLDKIGLEPFSQTELHLEVDVDFCKHLREKGVFMYVSNMEYYGHLKSMKTFQTKRLHPDLYQLIDNRLDWEQKYLHPDFDKHLENGTAETEKPCPDVFWVPMVKELFAQQLIDECENFGDWSSGGHDDKRLQGGYEAVPTVDIHMNQIGFEEHWFKMLKSYFAPVVRRLFNYNSKSQSIMNFVVKYTTTGQYLLRPHHDASTYTINLALNKASIDFQGGGARYIRYNCSVANTKVGWALLHPGRLTHYHEGLEITNGTRYIMVSFVDP